MAFYKICPDCGAYLDPGEQCSCHEEHLIEMERKEKATAFVEKMVKEERNKACGLVCKVEDFKPASNNFRSEFIGKDQSGRKQYRGISFKKTQFGSIEDINYYPLMKEFIEIAGKSELLKTVKDYCREHCAWLKTENDIENHAIDCLLSKAYEYWKDFPKQMPEPDKWIFYFKSIKMLERNL